MQPPKPPKTIKASIRDQPSSKPSAPKGKRKTIKALVQELRDTKEINLGDLKTLRMEVAGKINHDDHQEIGSLKEIPTQQWGTDVQPNFNKWFDRLKVKDSESAPKKESGLAHAIEIEGLRIVPQASNAIQLMFEVFGERRSLMILGKGVSLERHPDDFPDVPDFCAMLYGLGEVKLDGKRQESLYNYLAFVAQCLNPLPLAKIVGFIAQNPTFLSAKLVPQMISGLEAIDPEAAALFRHLASTTNLNLPA